MREPRYGFATNPFPDNRISCCPLCESRNGQRKVLLVIHIEPHHLAVLDYTCRYCKSCDLLVAHQHELEHLLTELFRRVEPTAVGNEYLILGTLDRAVRRASGPEPMESSKLVQVLNPFSDWHGAIQMSCGGWFPANTEPPLREPPPSQDWVKPASPAGLPSPVAPPPRRR